MKSTVNPTDAAREYAEACAALHIHKELPLALELFTSVLRDHPNTVEASYSEAQIERIARHVVPSDEIFAAHLRLAREHLRMPTETSADTDPLATSFAAAFPTVMPD